MLTTLAIAGYRSLRDVIVPLGRLNLITGPNGSGKSSLYRALRLLAETAQGRVVQCLAQEGGLASTMWAGPETISRAMKSGDQPIQGTVRRSAVRLRLGFAADDFSYLIDLGFPPQERGSPSLFKLDPHIRRESIWHGSQLRPQALLLDRRGPGVRLRGEDGGWETLAQAMAPYDSAVARLADPRNAPEVLMLRDSMRGWRFYDCVRTDRDAPARMPQTGTFTPVVGDDGRDLAAAIETIREAGDEAALAMSVEDAFPGSQIRVENQNGRFVLQMEQRGLLRPLQAAEISDGTLRYLLWLAALLTPRPPELMVLNEPETSLHPDLLAPLGRLIARAAESCQVLVVSHSAGLIEELRGKAGCHVIGLQKTFGETIVTECPENAGPAWRWPEL